MFNRLVVGAIALAAFSSFAHAQSTTSPAQRTAPPPAMSTDPHAADASMGMQMANSATMAIEYVTMKPADLMSSKLVGINVYNNHNESLGEIEDLVIENGHTITGVVVSVGGFLGMGESYVAVDPSTIVLNQKDGTWRAFVDTSKDNLKNAPKFSYTKKK